MQHPLESKILVMEEQSAGLSSSSQLGIPTQTTTSASLPESREARVRIIVLAALIALSVVCVAVKLFEPFTVLSEYAPTWIAHELLPRVRIVISWWSLEAMLFYPFGLLLIFALERRYPAIPTQKTLSTGLVHDGLWVLIEAVAAVVMIQWYSRFVHKVYSQHLSFLTLSFAQSLPELARLAIGAVALDFGRWCQHWLHHNVRWLWPFHALHHSQRELNLFSDYRVHIVEYFVRYAIMVFPMLLLGVQAPSLIWWTLLLSWHARLYHANVRMNFGPLRYIFVTPQSHRVHHSREREHFDLNYGAMLSIWDYLFRTQYRRYDVYPETGVDDEKFPGETAQSVAGVLLTPLRQMLYPFRQLWTNRRRVEDVAPPAESPNA